MSIEMSLKNHEGLGMAEKNGAGRGTPKVERRQRIAQMDKDILDVEGAAAVLGVSTRTVYNLARKGEIPAMRVGREWRFARQNLIAWVTHGSQADQLAAALRNGKGGEGKGVEVKGFREPRSGIMIILYVHAKGLIYPAYRPAEIIS